MRPPPRPSRQRRTPAPRRAARDAAATEAEQAAKDAEKYAREAQEAADRAEKAEKGKDVEAGTVLDKDGSIGNMFYTVDRYEKIGEPKTVDKTDACDKWYTPLVYTGGCTMTVKIRLKAYLSLYMCSAEGIDPMKYMCPAGATSYVGPHVTEVTQKVTHTITMAEFNAGIDPVDVIFGSWIKCFQKLIPGGAARRQPVRLGRLRRRDTVRRQDPAAHRRRHQGGRRLTQVRYRVRRGLRGPACRRAVGRGHSRYHQQDHQRAARTLLEGQAQEPAPGRCQGCPAGSRAPSGATTTAAEARGCWVPSTRKES